MILNRSVNRHFKAFALIAAMMTSHFCGAVDLSGDWVGQLAGPFDTQYTAQYNHVTIKSDGSQLSGTWGTYEFSGSITDDKVQLSLMFGPGQPAGSLHGTLSGGSFSGTGSIRHRSSLSSSAVAPMGA